MNVLAISTEVDGCGVLEYRGAPLKIDEQAGLMLPMPDLESGVNTR